MKEKVLVIGVSQYSFTDEATKQQREGAHVTYVSDYLFETIDKKGYFPVKIALPFNAFAKVSDAQFPAVCELDMKTIPDGKGRPVSTIVGITYVKHSPIFTAATA